MTSLYDVPLLKGKIVIKCPQCGQQARFRTPGGGPLPVMWQRSDYKQTLGPWHGEVTCLHCGQSGVHALNWPDEAWFSIEVGNVQLWALDEPMLQDIRNFIAATDNRADVRRASPHSAALHRLPAEVLKANRRDEVLRKIDRMLPGEITSDPGS